MSFQDLISTEPKLVAFFSNYFFLFLSGLKILIICFPDFLANEWRTIAAALKEVVLVGPGRQTVPTSFKFIPLFNIYISIC